MEQTTSDNTISTDMIIKKLYENFPVGKYSHRLFFNVPNKFIKKISVLDRAIATATNEEDIHELKKMQLSYIKKSIKFLEEEY